MVDRVSFSCMEQSLENIAIYHADVQAGIYEFFGGRSKTLYDRYSATKISEALDNSLVELDFTSSLSVLSSVEAAIRIDYLRRVYGRWRDPLSRAMKVLHQKKESGARLEDDLVRLWREQTDISRALLGELVAAFKYRHWLAHGRYWTPKFGRRYDYETTYEISEAFINSMEEYNNEYVHGNTPCVSAALQRH